MPAVWARARSELRGRLWAWVGIAVLVGLAGGVVIAAGAGARRTDAAYPRFLASHTPADTAVAENEIGLTKGADLDAVARLPQVARVSRGRYMVFTGRTNSGRAVGFPDLAAFADADRELGTTINRWKILAGRRPDPRRADEAMASSSAADAFGLHVGSTLQLGFVRRETLNVGISALRSVLPARVAGRDRSPLPRLSFDGPALTFRVVGIDAAPDDLPPRAVLEGKGVVHLTPAFSRTYAARDLAGVDLLFVRLRPGADVAGFKADVERVPATASVNFVASSGGLSANVQRSIHVQALALWLLAALVGVSALLVLAQTLARQALLESSDYPTLRALGMTRGQLWAVGMVRAGVVAALGAVLAVGLAILASPLSPVGTARIVEPTPGFSLDALALVVGAAGIVMLVLVVAAFPTWRAAGTTAGVAGAASEVRHSVLAESLARASAPLPAVLGVRLALEPGQGRSAVPVRSTVLAGVLAIATVTMAVTFGASLAHLSHTPRLYGWNWDAQIGSGSAPDISAPLIEGLRANPAVASFSVGTMTEVAINGVRVDAYAQDQVQGSVPPTLLSGRAPARPDEIVVGTQTLRTARARIGQTVTVRIGARTLSMRVVGRGVFPSIGDAGQLGKGAQLSYEAFQRLASTSASPRNVVLVRFTPRVDRRATLAQLNRALAGMGLYTDLKPADLTSFGQVDTLPAVLAAILAVMAAATLTHTLITSIRRRRHDLAILKTLGLAPAQVRRVVAWQASTLGGVALLFGLPLGLAAGRWAWTLFADQLGVAPQPAVPALALLLAIPATILLANLIATAPAWAAGRTRPALVLRAE